eukprot:g8451.t1
MAMWHKEEFDLQGVEKLEDLRHFVMPVIAPAVADKLAKKKGGRANVEKSRWQPREKTIFAFMSLMGDSDGLIRPGETLPKQLPDDDSTRLISFVTPFANYVGCYDSNTEKRELTDKQKAKVEKDNGNPDDVAQGKCGKSSGAKKIFPTAPLGGKGLGATLKDFQEVRKKCFELQKNGGLLASSEDSTITGSCDFVDKWAAYFNRDNGKQEISVAIHGSGGYEFNSQYQVDRQRAFNGLGKLPGNEYCNGPSDRLSEDGGTRFCSCARDGRRDSSDHLGQRKKDLQSPLEVSEPPVTRKKFVDLSKIDLKTVPEDEVPRITWTQQWESMTSKERDDYLMLQSYRDLNVNFWASDETLEYKDQDPCKEYKDFGGGGGSTKPTQTNDANVTSTRDEGDASSSVSSTSCGGSDSESESFVEKPSQKERSSLGAVVKIPGQSRQGDFHKAVYEFYGPLVSKIVDMDHGGDLSQVAFYGSSEGGAMIYELSLYLMHKKISDAVAGYTRRGVLTAEDLRKKILGDSPEKRRPFCVGGTFASDSMPRPESIQGKHNWKRLQDTAAICGDLVKWTSGLKTTDTFQYIGLGNAIYDPNLVLHQLGKIAAAGYSTVEVWELPSDHPASTLLWSIPLRRRQQRMQKFEGDKCHWQKRGLQGEWNGYLFPFRTEGELHAADPVTKMLPDSWQAEIRFCHTAVDYMDQDIKDAKKHQGIETDLFPPELVENVRKNYGSKKCIVFAEDGDQTGYKGKNAGDLDAQLGAYAMHGRAFGGGGVDKYLTTIDRLMYLTRTVKGGPPPARRPHLKPFPGHKVTRHVRRHFQAFRQCVYENKGDLNLKDEEGKDQLVPEEFDFFEWEREKGEEDQGDEEEDDAFLQKKGEDDGSSAFLEMKSEEVDDVYYGGTELRKQRAAFFQGDELCPEHVDPDPAFLGFEEQA